MKLVLALSASVALAYTTADPAPETEPNTQGTLEEREIFCSRVGNGIRKSQAPDTGESVELRIQAGMSHQGDLASDDEDKENDNDLKERDIFGFWIGRGILKSQAGTTARLVSMGSKAGVNVTSRGRSVMTITVRRTLRREQVRM